MLDTQKRILLVAEAVTLAHVARPLVFARGLAADRYRVAVACDHRAVRYVQSAGLQHVPLRSITAADFIRALALGRALYDEATLRRYVEDDLRAIDAFRPDLIVGDFRLSLSVSARLAGVPYATIASAYWSPYYEPPRWPVPALPFTRWLPIRAAQAIFEIVRPFAFELHCRPMNATRHRFGLSSLPGDLRLAYTDADYVLYSDLPSLFPLKNLPATHRFLGPALWEPSVELPPWWHTLTAASPIVYVTLGSSGDAALLPRILNALSALPVDLIVATAGRGVDEPARPNVFAAPYLPGLQAAQRARVVVCNGGSLTCYQALAAGVPVVGVAGNLDQFLNMQGVESAGAGVTLRADRLSAETLVETTQLCLQNMETRSAAAALQNVCRKKDFEFAAADFVTDVLGTTEPT